jgi:Glutaminase
MPKSNAVLSTTIRLDPPLDRPVDEALRTEGGQWVELEGERRLRLDPEDSRSGGFAQVLDGLRKQQLPVYVEFDAATSAVTLVRVPYVSPVVGLRTVDRGVFDVVLALSHARHVLRETSEDFGALRERLDQAVRTGAPVILVDDDEHEVIDVLLAPPGFDEPVPKERPRPRWPWRWFLDIRDILRRLWWWYWWPWWWFRCSSAARAQQVFNDMQATSCDPLTVPPPCIPFRYPDDGCWGRAHEMCRLMMLQGLKPRKVWIQGSLHVATRNNPTCNVFWGWHVAPTLCVRGPKFFQHQDMVIDPSLFTTPVTKAQWKGVQGDPMATLTDTDASVFHLFYAPHHTDPTYALTNNVLNTYRLALQSRSISQGPPPYANCP